MIENIQGTSLADVLYYAFHVWGFVFVFMFNTWYGKKKDIPIWKSTVATILIYSVTYLWIYILYWIEHGFKNFGGNNIVRGFVYIPLIAYPVAKIMKINWTKMCDFIAPCVCLAHGISHIGCIFAGCCEGYPCEWGIYNIRYSGTAFPVQIFESLTALIIFVLLVYLSKKRNYKTYDKAYPLMLIMFGSTRFLWEFARNNEKIWLGCSALAFHALFMCIVGVIIFFAISYSSRTNQKNITRRKRI